MGPTHHTIIEAHPDVLRHMREQRVYDWPGVRVLEGRWQDWLLDEEKLAEVRAGTFCRPRSFGNDNGFHLIFMDTFAEGYEGDDSI